MSASKVVKIDFFTAATLPARLKEAAGKQGYRLGKGIIAVKTFISSPPSYGFITVGTTPAEVQTFMETLAKEDGFELGKVARKAFREDN